MSRLYVSGAVLLFVYGQLVLKWRIDLNGTLPAGFRDKTLFFVNLFIDPFMFSVVVAAFFASVLWVMALTKAELSYVYPFLGLTYVLVVGFAVFFFNEPLTIEKIFGSILITLGIAISGREL